MNNISTSEIFNFNPTNRIKMGDNHLIGEQFWASEQLVHIIFFSHLFLIYAVLLIIKNIKILQGKNW